MLKIQYGSLVPNYQLVHYRSMVRMEAKPNLPLFPRVQSKGVISLSTTGR
jgi:hypothetical protein